MMPGPLDQLPADIAELAAAVPMAAKSMALSSADRWFRPSRDSDTYALGSARLEWHFFFERSTGWSFLLFHEKKRWIPLDARVSTLARPASTPPPPPGDLNFLIHFPSFLWLSPTQADLDRFAPSASTPENAILFRLHNDGDILGVRMDKMRLRYSPGGEPLPEEPQGGAFPVLPFVLLAETLTAWVGAGMPMSPESIPLAGGKPLPVREVIERLGEAWQRSQAVLANTAAPLQPFYSAHWRAAEFRSDVQIRLNDKGQLAKKEGDERFSILLRMLARNDDDQLQITAAPGLPAKGVFDAVLDFFQFTVDGNRAMAGALARYRKIPPPLIPGFIQSARQRASIVRLEKDGADHWILMVLRGKLVEREATVIALAPMRIDELANPPTAGMELFGEDLSVLANPFESPLNGRTDDVERLFAWIGNFGRWVDLLQ